MVQKFDNFNKHWQGFPRGRRKKTLSAAITVYCCFFNRTFLSSAVNGLRNTLLRRRTQRNLHCTNWNFDPQFLGHISYIAVGNHSKPKDDGPPAVKRPRGRPKGSKNKNPKPKPVVTGPKRPRGRPRKWPPPDTSLPKRSRGRPRKNAQVRLDLPTMVGTTDIVGTPSLTANATSTVTAPIATDIVPPEYLFNSDEAD